HVVQLAKRRQPPVERRPVPARPPRPGQNRLGWERELGQCGRLDHRGDQEHEEQPSKACPYKKNTGTRPVFWDSHNSPLLYPDKRAKARPSDLQSSSYLADSMYI